MPNCSESSASEGARPNLASQRFESLVQLAGLRAYQARHPVHGAQLVEHGATDTRHAIRFEFDAARQIERVDGVHQAEDTGRDEVI